MSGRSGGRSGVRWMVPSLLVGWSAGAMVIVLAAGIAPAAAATSTAADPFDHDHAAWTELLRTYVSWARDGHHAVVDYSGFKDDRRLHAYIASLSSIDRREFEDWTRAEQLAFLLNTYNAYTVALVAGYYPEIESIRDIGGWSSPWTYEFIPLFGRKVSLDHIEHDLIRGEGGYPEPRVHFAINCASVGCPPLRPEAYTAEHLEAQLQDAEVRFLTDRTRNRVHVDRLFLEVSPIFDWYIEDFGQDEENLKRYFAAHAELLAEDQGGLDVLRSLRFDIGFGGYDWSLNDLQPDDD